MPEPTPLPTPQLTAEEQNLLNFQNTVQEFLDARGYSKTLEEVAQLKTALEKAENQLAESENERKRAAAGPVTYITTSKPPDPPKFKGAAKDLAPFLHAMEDHMRSSFYRAGSSDFDNVLFFSRFLDQGDPQSWHESIRENHPHLLLNFIAYIDAFKIQFENPHLAKEHRLKLSQLKQTGSVSSYSVKFKTLAAIAKVEEETMIDWFFRGLKLNIQERLITGSGLPPLFETLVKQAMNVDHLTNAIRNSNQSPSPNSPSTYSKPNQPSSSSPASTSVGPWPMDIDSIKTRLVNGKVPAEERARRLKEGLCAYCAGAGHIADDCPTKKAKSQQGKASPQA